MVRVCLLSLVSIALGVGAGIAITGAELGMDNESFGRLAGKSAEGDRALRIVSVNQSGPKALVVDGPEYNFGVMELHGTKTHTFEIKNVGTAPLTLQKGKSTCKCTVFDVDNNTLAAGRSAFVTLEWKGEQVGGANPDFSQTAEIWTNDPDQELIGLTIYGHIVQSYRASPSELEIKGVVAKEGVSVRSIVFAYEHDDLEITDLTLENRETAEYFDVRCEPLSTDDLVKEPGARSARQVLVTIKPGAPLGTLEQTVHLTTNLPDSPVIDLPITATVESDFRVFGANYDIRHQVLKLGAIPRDQGTSTDVFIWVKGAKPGDVELQIAEVDPADRLRAELGPAEQAGSSLKFRVSIEVPKGAEPVNRVGSQQAEPGRILIKTTHPDVKELKIRVSYIVE